MNVRAMDRVILGPMFALALTTSGTAGAKEPFKPNLGPDLPAITIHCGEVGLLMRQSSQWTPGRIDFRGAPMTTERSAYGTVFSFPDVGFIGTAHLENEPEKLQSLAFFVDGKAIGVPGPELAGTTFRLERHSQIRSFDLTNRIEIKDDRLYETTTVSTAQSAPLKLVYHFMHAWMPTVSAFMAGKDDAAGKAVAGDLRDEADVVRKFYINDRVDWMAVYEPKSGQFAVSRLLEAPEEAGNIATIWNVPGTYRKFYLKCFNNGTVPAGFRGTWRMVTGFGAATPKQWREAAQALAARLRQN